MHFLLLLASFLFATSISYGSVICNEENDLTFFADKSTACEEYFICYNGRLTRFACPTGFAFHDFKSRCVEASAFTCVEELEENEISHSRYKRSDVLVHSISKAKAKESAWHLMESIKTDVMDALKEAAPSVYDSIEDNYIPILLSIKNDIMPIVKQSVLPRVQKAYTYGKNLGDRVVKKLHQSWEMSNSTHINLVSFSDVASDVSDDLKPLIQLGKYFSSRLTSRPKRSIYFPRSLFETVSSFIQPVATAIFKGVSSAAAANDPFLRDYVLPMVFEMTDDPQTAAQIKEIVWIAKRIYSPIASEFFRGRSYGDFNGVVFQVSNPVLDDAKFRLYKEVKPIVSNILERHLQMILYRTGVHLPLITATLERIEVYSGNEVKDLKHDLLFFFAKHSEFFWTNDASFRNVKTFTEMKEELKPIKKNLLKVAMDYLSHSPNSWLNMLFNRNSFLYRLL
ncbi:hypothetical protein AVEN_96773-1 [Araneus ventricosus]|uniref:Chitin-binding type-2 domain-containing protein n=1 Tax=Araneus ventricosus TaxID=182803 RepID=A0A4Y2IL55_ARAVE|nr:hypothetical protein AVEN_96773-1 [Araneus ventricosus]